MARHRVPIIAALLGVAILSTPVRAGEAADLAAQAEELAAAGNHAQAMATMRDALLTVWHEAPLTFTKAIFVSADPGGYGIYQQRPDNVFEQGETMLIYTEPAGFGWGEQDGHYRSDLVADFEVRTADGTVLGGQKGFGRFTLNSLVENTEYMARVSIGLTGLEPGAYVLGLTFNDAVDGGSASVDLPFEVR